MKPLSLILRGFTGIQKGLGLDEIMLDLSGVHGLIALAGENGRGKSSVLENLHPFRTLFSRSGALNRHCYLRNSEKEFTFSYQGHIYRTLVKIDAEADRGEAYVWRDGQPEVNGKYREYDRYIENLLGSQTLFASSVFCAQNSRKLTDMRTGELRELFAEFLRLDRLQAHEATSKQCINTMAGQIQQVEARISMLKAKVEQADIGDLAIQAAFESARLESQRTALQARFVEEQAAMDRTKAAIAANAANIQRRKDVQQAIDDLTAEIARGVADQAVTLAGLRDKYAKLKAEFDACCRAIVDKEAIEAAAKDEAALRQLIDMDAADVDTMGADLAQRKKDLAAVEKEWAAHKQKLSEATADLNALKTSRELMTVEAQIKQAKDKTKDLDLKDPACQSTTCSFVAGALEAARTLPDLEAQREQIAALLEVKRAAINGTIKDIEAMINAEMRLIESDRRGVEATEAVLLSTRQSLARHKLELKQLSDRAARLPELLVAISRHDDLSKQMSDVTEAGITARTAWAKTLQEKNDQLGTLQARHTEITGMIDQDAEKMLPYHQSKIREIEGNIKIAGDLIEQSKAEIVAMQTRMALAAAAKDELAATEKDLCGMFEEMSHWTYLRNACSKTGLQALEIDGVVPLITHDANRLLAGTFGPTFSIRLQTQDEDGKEVFRVLVIRDDGAEVLLDNLSGGERVWILKALRLSMTLLSKRKSGLNFTAAFADEEDGALDVENARTFVDMYRSFMKEGGFESFLFISHKPECLSYADHILRFEAGKSPAWG